MAKADLVVDGVTLAKDLPVTYLLFLEKQLTELKAFVSKFHLGPGRELELRPGQ